ncbi:hypothetical protein P375_11060 [Gallibacterium genomosp. 2]|uniref:DUF3577 domain-containing protein n=1 Tax=Gallibacterium genomosp. 2 TaxID=155517 RepID=A0A0A2XD45_9PAST|nr:DUF3577 domain-containing protein [Gallibacterium genomosp. 2]KGQ30053.1 hypothetical protein P375_11060 [Gallibacterium genomosp. 2]
MNIQYFNLYTNGIGYINQIQKIDTEESTNSFVTCRISALVGNNTNIKYRSFDTIISNKDVEKLVLRCQQAVNQGKKVLISFVLSDIWYETFLHKKNGKYYKKGDPGVSLKAYLIKINMIKIDGETKYLSDQDYSY